MGGAERGQERIGVQKRKREERGRVGKRGGERWMEGGAIRLKRRPGRF